MEFTFDVYTLTIDDDEDKFDVNLFESKNLASPLLYLSLKPLNEIDTEFDDKTEIRDIPRSLFNAGDFYQSSVMKYTTSQEFQSISLLSIVHQIFLINHEKLNFLKRIYSTSLNNYREEGFITTKAKNFWDKQLVKFPNLPVYFFEDDKRYYILINE